MSDCECSPQSRSAERIFITCDIGLALFYCNLWAHSKFGNNDTVMTDTFLGDKRAFLLEEVIEQEILIRESPTGNPNSTAHLRGECLEDPQ
jgi:hypothetical protein